MKMSVESKFCCWQSYPFSHLKPRIHNARSPLVQALEIDATPKMNTLDFEIHRKHIKICNVHRDEET